MTIAQDVKCHNCGAPLSLKAGEVIITCEYCGTAFNVATDKKFFLKHSIIPSKLDEKGVLETVRRWMSTGALKPSNFQKASKIEGASLTFLPFYIVHINVTTSYEGSFTRTGGNEPRTGKLHKEYYWKILGRRGSRFPTREYEIPLSGKEDFNLSKISKVAKFLNAEFDEKDAEDLAKGEVADNQRFLLSSQVNIFKKVENTFEIEDIEFVHAPVWKVDFVYNKTSYQVLLCGSNGNVIRGDIPPPDQSVGGFFSDLKKAFSGR
ncbi:MAG: hypothetical protein MUC62_10575 [Candidatus Thermoplasmatota archaeon]|jgi:hypothetical protein|nr:hypothetical protein [Candidatus Thermoplasmatota archaeon]